MTPPLFSICAASAAVMALIGSSPVRLWPFGEAIHGAALPYAVWQIFGGSPENYLNQPPDLDRYSIQVDIYAATGGDARAVAEALRDAIEPHAHITAWRGESKDPETRKYRFTFEIDWFVPR